MPKILTVASGKGGVGKTNISVNLSLALNNLGFKTCLFDGDLGLANANLLLGIYPDKNLEDVVLNQLPLKDIVVRTADGLELIPGSSGLEIMANLNDGRLKTTLKQLTDLADYDFIILDCSSGIARQTISFCLAASEVILVFTPEPTSLVDSFAMLKVLRANDPALRVRALINNCPDQQSAKVGFSRMKQAAAQYLNFDLRPVGLVPKDWHVTEAVRNQRPFMVLYPKSSAARCLKQVAERLGDEYRGRSEEQSLEEFWLRYFEVLRQPLMMPGSQSEPSDAAAASAGTGETRAGEAKALAVRAAKPAPSVPTPAKPAAVEKTAPQPATVEPPEPEVVEPKAEAPQAIAPEPPAPEAIAPEAAEAEVQPWLAAGIRELSKFRPRPGLPQTGNVNLLPTSPLALLRIIRMLDDDLDALERIHDLARLDAGLCLNILVRAGLHPDHVPAEVLNLKRALKTLGWQGIRGLVFHLAALQVLTPWTESEMRTWENLTREGIRHALFGEAWAEHFDVGRSEAYLAGLFSSLAGLFGHPVSAREPEEVQGAQAAWGADLLEELGFPSLFTDAIRYVHERPERIGQALPLVQAAHVARRAAQGLAVTDQVRETMPPLAPDWQAGVEETFGRVLAELGLDHPEPDLSHWTRAREALAAEVRTMVLETGALLAASGLDESSAASGHPITDLASELGAGGVMLFAHQPENNRLAAKYFQGQAGAGLLNQMSLPADRGANAIVRCWMTGRTCHSLNQAEGKERQLVDEQLRRLMKVEALACWPLNRAGQPRGVLVLGGETAGLRRLMVHPDLPNLMARATRLLAGLTEGRNTPVSAAI